jgi:hypothetical protein
VTPGQPQPISPHDVKDRVHRKGVLFSAGLITDEALIGIVMAILIVASGKADVLALAGVPAPRSLAGAGHARRDRVAVVSYSGKIS